MDLTLRQILDERAELFQAFETLREQNRQLQAAYTDIKNQLEACNAVVDLVQ